MRPETLKIISIRTMFTLVFFISANTVTAEVVEEMAGIDLKPENHETVITCDLNGEEVSASVSTLPVPTDSEGRLKEPARFYFVKLKYGANYFSFNIPAKSFDKLTESQKEGLIKYLIALYDKAFKIFAGIFGYVPEGYKFNVTFGKTASNMPFNRVYLASKTSNIFPDLLPYENGQNVLSEKQRWIMFHEIGHSLFGIAIGNLRHPGTRSIEEGFAGYMAGEGSGWEIGAEGEDHRFPISAARAERIEGLAQLDIDVSVWGEEIVFNAPEIEGYAGLTHHVYGVEFINSFINIFNKKDLPEFLVRLRAKEGEPRVGDFGTGQIRDIFTEMGYPDEKVSAFKDELYSRLRKNVFRITE